jgi:hypothetical protein
LAQFEIRVRIPERLRYRIAGKSWHRQLDRWIQQHPTPSRIGIQDAE